MEINIQTRGKVNVNVIISRQRAFVFRWKQIKMFSHKSERKFHSKVRFGAKLERVLFVQVMWNLIRDQKIVRKSSPTNFYSFPKKKEISLEDNNKSSHKIQIFHSSSSIHYIIVPFYNKHNYFTSQNVIFHSLSLHFLHRLLLLLFSVALFKIINYCA